MIRAGPACNRPVVFDADDDETGPRRDAGITQSLARQGSGYSDVEEVDILAEHRGIPLWFVRQGPILGAVLPSNSPGVNALWLPALFGKDPLGEYSGY